MNLTITPEGLAQGVLPGVEAELIAERMAAPVRSPAQREAVAYVATAASQGQPVSADQLQSAGISSDDFNNLSTQATQIDETLGERIEDWIHHGEGWLAEVAKHIVTRSEEIGVSTASYLEKLQKRLLQYLISTYLLDPIKVQQSTGPSMLGAKTVGLQATVTLQPSVSAGVDVVQAFIVSLFNMSFQLTVGYGDQSS
jgi:hypothetical protein